MLTKELCIYRRINQAISFAPDVEAVASSLLDIVIDETVAENSSIMMPSADKAFLEIKAAKGRTDKKSRYSEESLGMRFPMGTGIAGSVALKREPVLIYDASTEPLFANGDGGVTVGSLLSLPLIYGSDELVGVLNLSHTRPHAFTQEDLALVNVLLPPAALALRNARLMRDIEDINRMLKAELSMTDRALWEFGKNIFRVFTYMSVGVLTTDPNGIITTINKKANEEIGKVAGDSITDIIDIDLLQQVGTFIQDLSVDRDIRGKIFNLELSILPLKPSWQILICVRDVTFDRFKERELVRIKDQYKDMVEKAIDAVYIVKDGKFLLTNRKFQEMLGYVNEEIMNRHIRHFMTRDSIHTLAKVLRSHSGNIFVPNLELQAIRKDGSRLYLEISIGRLTIEEEQCYVGVVRDITSKKELLALKTRFLHIASHEIRVPLTVIRGYGRMLARDAECSLSESQRECITEIEKQCEKLLHFSNSLLDFAKINTEKISLNKQKVNVVQYIGGIIRNMQVNARDRGVVISLESVDAIDELFIDPMRFEQALCNLIDNAIKHSPDNGLVRIVLSRSMRDEDPFTKIFPQASAIISVIDEGPGIDADEARELFYDFYVGNSGRAKGGIGLGLAITKDIIHAHGGRVEAVASDHGGHFLVTIPLNSRDY
ncbi:MAG: PAS domain S-box protein [Desulfomonilia bacterium]|nr:PAS domain S-box protein [Desulfomonilia bacterium]